MLELSCPSLLRPSTWLSFPEWGATPKSRVPGAPCGFSRSAGEHAGILCWSSKSRAPRPSVSSVPLHSTPGPGPRPQPSRPPAPGWGGRLPCVQSQKRLRLFSLGGFVLQPLVSFSLRQSAVETLLSFRISACSDPEWTGQDELVPSRCLCAGASAGRQKPASHPLGSVRPELKSAINSSRRGARRHTERTSRRCRGWQGRCFRRGPRGAVRPLGLP